MLKHVLYASAALALLAAPSLAAPVTGSVAIIGSVDAVCSMPTTLASINLGSIALDSSGKSAGTTSGTVSTTALTWCNGNTSRMKIVVKPLTSTSFADPGVFTNIIPYNVVGLQPTALESGILPAGNTAFDAVVTSFVNDGTNPVTVNTEVTSLPIVAGAYSGEVAITLTPGA
jgi:hypothetical protein